ncbi:protein serine/threonine phosphatase 2C [Calocera cornea HHB12733]|uniref:Protein serine/threonine phosphatase 2C n=1 Tax=Calocera cornea HHB12733 TaxID=1353952 RepID=A0A165D5Z8_9BASI|nr:protein serine/threonine phosphatase 2C [Calocera cornea HHB12733]
MESVRPSTPPLHTNEDTNTVLPYYRFPGECPSPLRYAFYDTTQLDSRLSQTAKAVEPIKEKAWAVSFQPCLGEGEDNQDRWVVELWDDRWMFAAIFDGHAGMDTAEHVSHALPSLIKQSLYTLLQEGTDDKPGDIRRMLSQQIQSYDAGLAAAVKAIFPVEQLSSMSEEEIDRLVNDHLYGGTGEIHDKVLRCMRGTTAVIVLVDTKNGEMWTAGLGDSEAVLASITSGHPTAMSMNGYHNGTDPREVDLIRTAHPGEDATSVFNSRVLGAIAVTRALGDHEFKLPAIYTEKVFLRAREPGFAAPARVEQVMLHNLTPPYLSSEPDVRYHRIREKDKYLLLCSDGLRDLWEYEMRRGAERYWARMLCEPSGQTNLALRVLRSAIGGPDEEKCSMLMGLQLEEKWMDDTTIVVVALH